MAKIDQNLIDQWSDRNWRLNNLYWITDAYGKERKFQLNAAQQKLLTELHTLNLILKARQMGFSTFILLLALDCALFNDHFSAGLIADTLDNAKDLLKRIKFAYERLPEPLRKELAIKSDNATELEMSNGSSVKVGTSLRSGTYNLIHVSEYGKICARFPDKSKEIKSGALNTIAPGQLVFIESTAEGKGGDFYDKVQSAQAICDAGKDHGQMDYKLHFFPWFDEPRYTTADALNLTADDEKYFDLLSEKNGIELSTAQRRWYAGKSREQGDDMLKEYPSTPEEAFEGAADGAYYGKAIRNLRKLGQIGKVAADPRSPVNTFWDLGVSDDTVIWLHQYIAQQHRFVGYFEDSGEGIGYYLKWLEDWATPRSVKWGKHFGPHDIDHKRMGKTARSIKDHAKDLGFAFEVVERTPDLVNSIQNVRGVLPSCCFDEQACDSGIAHLERYSREWNEKLATWRSHPRHDEHSHAADAFRTFADGWQDGSASAGAFDAYRKLQGRKTVGSYMAR